MLSWCSRRTSPSTAIGGVSMKHSLFVAGLASFWLAGVVASAQTATPTVMSPAQVAVSQPLRDGKDDSNADDRKVHNHQPLPHHGSGGNQQDDALQTSAGPLVNATGGTRFPGVGASGSAPGHQHGGGTEPHPANGQLTVCHLHQERSAGRGTQLPQLPVGPAPAATAAPLTTAAMWWPSTTSSPTALS